MTQQQADAYGAKWQDQVFRNQQITAWRHFATTKYGNAANFANKAVTAQQEQMQGAAQQQQLTYIVGIAVIILIAAGAYVMKKHGKEAAEVKK
jgi:hypothetical protein